MLKRVFSAASYTLTPARKYWIFIAGISFVIFGVIFTSVTASWFNLSPEDRAVAVELADRIIPFPLLGAFFLALVIGYLVTLLFRYYIVPILQLAESTQLISLANPGHRITPKGSREVIQLAEVINKSADAYQKLLQEVESTIKSAKTELSEERNRFAALMSELPSGVLVCNCEGQILLYNRQAQNMLQPSNLEKSAQTGQGGGWIGLGRSVYGVLQQEPIVDGLERLRQAVSSGEALPITRFKVLLAGDRSLRATMAPVMGHDAEQPEVTGLVLTLEDLTPQSGECLPVYCGPRPVYYAFDLFKQKPPQELGKQPLRMLTYVVFDTETTGLNPADGDEIIQLGAVRIINARMLEDEVIDQLIDPQRSIPATSVAIHGITPEMVVGKPTIDQVLPHFHHFAEGAILVAHNAAFDMRCLQVKEQQTGVRFDHPVLDTLLLSSIIHPHQDTHSLDGIAKRLDLTTAARHSACGDALLTAEVLLKLIPLLESRGIITLEDALLASMQSPYAKLTY